MDNQYDDLELKYNQSIKNEYYDSAEVYASRMLNLKESEPKSFLYGLTLFKMSKAQLKRFKHIESLENMLAARTIFISIDSLVYTLECDYFIGEMYKYEEDYTTLFIYNQHGLDYSYLLGDTSRIAKWCNRIGNTHMRLGNYSEAMKFELMCLNYSAVSNNYKEASYAYSTIGEIHYLQGELDSASIYMQKSLSIKKELGLSIAWLNSKIGKLYIELNDLNNAIEFCESGYKESQGKNSHGELFCAECLTEAYKKTGNYSKAFEMLTVYMKLKEEREGVKRYKNMTRTAYTDLYNEKAEADSLRHYQAQLVKDQQIEHESALKQYLYIVLVIVFLFLIFMINRFRIIRKQRNLIKIQKDEAVSLKKDSDEQRLMVEQKNKEITDSIKYAKRIQSAILPHSKIVEELLPESFILYKPKDVVAGDFYWLETVGETVLFAAADCTGHGVPGAMVSVICNNGLNRSVREHGLIEPGEILDKTREIVISEFEKSEDEVKDGMDIALCSILGSNLKYAGAHNPLWIIRNNEILETKANKQPIGQFDNPEPYKTHHIELEKGDVIYIFSDGIVDQFGGPKGKKFMARALKDLLLSIQGSSMNEQLTAINKAFDNWRGDLEQVDDVCMIGFRF